MTSVLGLIGGLLTTPTYLKPPRERERIYPDYFYSPTHGGNRGTVENPRLNMRNNYIPVKPDNGLGKEFLASDYRTHYVNTREYGHKYLKLKLAGMNERTLDPMRQLDANSYERHRSGYTYTNIGTGVKTHSLSPHVIVKNNIHGL
jgi:hypothetical protein